MQARFSHSLRAIGDLLLVRRTLSLKVHQDARNKAPPPSDTQRQHEELLTARTNIGRVNERCRRLLWLPAARARGMLHADRQPYGEVEEGEGAIETETLLWMSRSKEEVG